MKNASKIDPALAFELRSKAMASSHESLKKVAHRGEEGQQSLSTLTYLRGLERELEAVRKHLDEAWIWLDGSKDFRKTMRHADHAQQRLHRVIKRIAKRTK